MGIWKRTMAGAHKETMAESGIQSRAAALIAYLRGNQATKTTNCLAPMAARIFLFCGQFCGRQIELRIKENRIVPEAGRALPVCIDLAVPPGLDHERLPVIGVSNIHCCAMKMGDSVFDT